MGRVFQAFDRQDGVLVALKTLKTGTPDEVRTFEREVRILAGLEHERIVRLFDVGTGGEGLFFTMELLHGLPLDRLLGRMPPGEAAVKWLLGIGVKVLDGLEHIHARGLLHRDLKPSNIMVLAPPPGAPGPIRPPTVEEVLDSPSPDVKLLDFGLAREREALQAMASCEVSGTPLYLCPEQLEGASSIDERADLYSLGAVLYHLITGKVPFSTLSGCIDRRARPTSPAALNPGCSARVASVIIGLLEKEPYRRPPSARDAREQILALLDPARRLDVEAPRLLPPVFAGRLRELESIRQLLARAASGKGGCLHVVAERGMGKSWLFERSGIKGEALADFGVVPLRAAFSRGGSTLAGLRSLFRELIGIIERRRGVEQLHSALSPWCSRALSALGLGAAGPAAGEGPAVPVDVLRQDLPAAAAELARAAAGEQPLLIVLEDVQNADELEVEALARIERVIDELRAAVIFTYRPDAAGASKHLRRWLGEIDSEGRREAIVLSCLTDSDVKEVIERMLRPAASITAELVSALARGSEGRPLELARLVRNFWERGRIRLEGGVWTLHGPSTPDGERSDEPWKEVMAGLDEGERTVLAGAIILGACSSEDLLLDLASGGRHELQLAVRRTVRDLVQKGLLEEGPDGPVPGRDLEGDAALLEAVEGRLGAQALAETHRRAAGLLLERFREAPEAHFFRIAEHFERGGEAGKAIHYYLAAARHAARLYANQRGMEAYRCVLRLGGAACDLRAAREELGDLCVRVGEYPSALEHFRAIQPERGADASLLDKIGRVLHRQGDFAEALAVYSRALEISGGNPTGRAQALFRLGGLHLDRGGPADARGHLEESLKLYETLGDFQHMALVQFSLGAVEKSQGRLDAAVTRFEEALHNAERSGSPAEASTILNNLGNAYRAAGNGHKAVECLRRSIEIRERIGDRQGLAIGLNNVARVHSLRGDLSASRASTERALQIFRAIGDKKGVIIAQCNLGEALILQGEFAYARSLLLSTLEAAHVLKVQGALETTHLNLASLELDRGDRAAAIEHARRCLKLLPEDRPIDLRAQALGIAAAAALRLQDFEQAEDALREAMEVAAALKLREKFGQLAATSVRFQLERGDPERALREGQDSLAEAGKGMERLGVALLRHEVGRVYRELGPEWADRTEKELGTALKEFESMGSPHNAAATRVELAIYWRLMGEEAAAAELLTEAEREFQRIGAGLRVEELRSLRA